MKLATTVAITIFALVALAQLLRVLLAWNVTVNGIVIPFWVSIVVSAIGATLAIMLWREQRK